MLSLLLNDGKILRDRLCRVTGWSLFEEDPPPIFPAGFNITKRGLKINNSGARHDTRARVRGHTGWTASVEKSNKSRVPIVDFFIVLLVFGRCSS